VNRLLTYRQAARRVGRSVRTVKRWRHDGMPVSADYSGRVWVREDILLAWWRDRLDADPAHQYRLRKDGA
jgi:phage terminase Nu1 subunit (DNA packaging protein)